MRSIWKGSISFGLVNIPTRLYSATEEENIDFDYLHKADLSPVRYAKICEKEEKEIDYKEIIRGFQYAPGQYVAITDEEIEKAHAQRSKNIDILAFVDESEIDTTFFEKPYYLEPDKNAGKAYELLYQAMKQTKKVGVAKFVLRLREHLCIIKAEEKGIILNQLRFADEIRGTEELKIPKGQASDNEIKMAKTLVDQLTKPFNPDDYQDTYNEELKAVIDAKAKGKPVKTEVKSQQPAKVKDLMALLEQSVAQSS
jgi:DNA end-binding protein Ku